CEGTNVTLTEDGGDAISWSWTTGETTQSIVVTTSGTYGVTITDANGCQSYCQIDITVYEEPTCSITASPDTEVCEGTNVTLTEDGGDAVSWSWTTGETTSSIVVSASGTYGVTITDANGCESYCEIEITVYELPEAEASSKSPVSQGATIQLYGGPSGMASYYWTGPGGWTSRLQNPTRPNATTAMAGIYTLTVTNENGCSDDATTNVVVTVPPPPPPPAPARGGGGCPSTKYLTVDWEGNNTTEPLYSNDRLIFDLLGPSPDGSHNLFLERGTHAPIVGDRTYYLIVIRELEDIPATPENTVALVAFNVTPVGAVFDRDILLTLGLDESQLPENALNVTMAYYDDVAGAWVPLEFEAGGPNGVAELTLSAPINHFSIFGVLATLAPTPPPPAHFVGSGLNILPSVERIWEPVTFVTKIGESATITANIANDGGQEGTYIVELKLNGEPIDTQMVTLAAGRSQKVSFTVSGLDYGRYEVEVAGLQDGFTASRIITWWLILVIIVALGLIIWGVVWRRRRRRAHQAA
ncbi:MAG: hypothetical protein HXY36_03575, partial [Chloroflexi bacterium]|nr:hypothetical protein [Chloroflexota bacterium]